MTDLNWILGLPLEMAKEQLLLAGITANEVILVKPLRLAEKEGTLRVVSVRNGGQTLLVSAFQDATPAQV